MRFDLDSLITLVQVGAATVRGIMSAWKAGKIAVTAPVGADLTEADVESKLNAAEAKAAQVGDAAAGRIEGRHPSDH